MTKKIRRGPMFRAYLGPGEIIVDNFAGGGGASTGVALALGRDPDIAINHDPEAIAMHVANHPNTRHYTEDIYAVDPTKVVGGRPVGLAWFSPDCKHHSKAKGGKPRDQKIRGLAWVAARWAREVAPRVILLENVEEFLSWGPLFKTGPRAGQPDPARSGQTFRAFVSRLERLGYRVEWRLLKANDYGAPTSRRRLIVVARRDGRAIVWPIATHGPNGKAPHRAALEVIDWSVPIPSIFGRSRELADKTLARVARGIDKFVVNDPRPFIIPVNHGGDLRVHDGRESLRTITAHGRGSHALVVPYLVHRSNGERPGQAPRIYDIRNSLGTVVAQGQKHALVAAFLVRHYGERHPGEVQGTTLRKSLGTVTCVDHHALAAVFLTKFYGTSTGSPVSMSVPTVTATGQHIGLVAALLARHKLGSPRAPFVVELDGESWILADIFMRMLEPRELFSAQGFPDDYQIAPLYRGKPLTKTAQIKMCGNSVCPPLAAAIAGAQFQQEAA